jgi:hypothetical protein
MPMKTLAALATVLTLVTLGGAAFACDGYFKRSGDTAQNNERIIPPAGKTS